MLTFTKLQLYRKLVYLQQIIINFINIQFHIMIVKLKDICRKVVLQQNLYLKLLNAKNKVPLQLYLLFFY